MQRLLRDSNPTPLLVDVLLICSQLARASPREQAGGGQGGPAATYEALAKSNLLPVLRRLLSHHDSGGVWGLGLSRARGLLLLILVGRPLLRRLRRIRHAVFTKCIYAGLNNVNCCPLLQACVRAWPTCWATCAATAATSTPHWIGMASCRPSSSSAATQTRAQGGFMRVC